MFVRPILPRLAVAAALAVMLTAARAAPEEATPPGDGVLQLLHDKGLLPAAVQAEGGALVRQVRDATSDLVLSALNFLGVPYRRGGSAAEEGFDCSGFTRHVFELSLGRLLPRRVDDQATAAGLSVIRRDELQPGDLVFFNTLRRTFSHVGIYIGEGRFIHSPRSGSEVRIEDMRKTYWDRRFSGARRVDVAETPAGPVAGVAASALR